MRKITMSGPNFSRIAKMAAKAARERGEKTDMKSVNATAHLSSFQVPLDDVAALLAKTGKKFHIDETTKNIIIGEGPDKVVIPYA